MDNNIISAFIGLGSAIIVAILTGIFQMVIERKNRKIAEQQFEQSKKEYAEKMNQMFQEQRRYNVDKARVLFQSEMNRFYEGLVKEVQLYEAMFNELHYLNNIVGSKSKEFCTKGAYPYIDNNIRDIVGEISLPQNIAKLLGALRANISLYNAALEKEVESVVLQEGLQRISNLINPIYTECFTNYANAQEALRNYEHKIGARILEEK